LFFCIIVIVIKSSSKVVNGDQGGCEPTWPQYNYTCSLVHPKTNNTLRLTKIAEQFKVTLNSKATVDPHPPAGGIKHPVCFFCSSVPQPKTQHNETQPALQGCSNQLIPLKANLSNSITTLVITWMPSSAFHYLNGTTYPCIPLGLLL